MKLLTFHLTDIFFCKNPKFNEFADDNVYRYICYSHILSIKSWVCQCFVYQTSFFSSPALTYFKLTLTFGFTFPLLNSVPSLHPNFSGQGLSSQQDSNQTGTHKHLPSESTGSSDSSKLFTTVLT